MSDTPKKRGRPRKPDDQLKRPRAKKAEEAVEVELGVEQIEVGDTRGALALLDEATQSEIDREGKRAAMAAEIAKHRWTIATNFHRLADGKSKLDFTSRPFLEELYKDDGTNTVVIGSAQYGKRLSSDTLVLVPGGTKRIGDLKFGDKVIAVDGTIATVLGVYHDDDSDMFRVTFRDGRWVDACSEHRWEISIDGRTALATTSQIRLMLDDGISVKVPKPNVEGCENIDTAFESIRQIENKPGTCILVDHPRHLFVTANFVVSHNTEFAICDAVATAGICGLPIIWVISKQDKRDRFVKNRIDPCFNTVPFYKKLFEAARDRNAVADSNSVKHFGAGSINFLFATASREFTSIDAGKAIIDEHQECDPQNLARIPDRLSGHLWGMTIALGHPSSPGTESNQNLDWLYKKGDHREWHVPCPHCKEAHILNWQQHCVHEIKNEHGAILEVRPRDEEYRPGPNALDMRPICSTCHRPVFRLSRQGYWKKRHPENAVHSFRLSNIYNVNVRLDAAFNRYVEARHKPHDMAEFYNKYLGITYSLSGTKIEESMLDTCAAGESSGVAPYKFIPVTEMEWKRVLRHEMSV